MRDDAVVARGVDADHRDRLVGVAAGREAGSGDHRRHRLDAGVPVEHRAQRLPLVDRAQPLRARLDARQDASVRAAGALRPRDFLGRAHDDVRLRAQRAPDRVALQPVDQRRDEDDDGDADARRRR